MASDFFLAYNPHNTTEVWSFSGNTRRHVTTQDEVNFWAFVGVHPGTIAADHFDSVPVTTG